MQKYKASILLLFFFCLGLLCSCTKSGSASTSGAPQVLATIKPYFLLARQLAGNKVNINLLIPPNASPHTFALTPADIINWEKAALILANGLNLEQAVTANMNLQAPKILLAADCLPAAELLSPGEADTHEEDAGDQHMHDGIDPHIWLDPENLILIAAQLSLRFSRLLPEEEPFFKANLQQLTHELTQLDNDIMAQRASLNNPGVITFHNSFTYFLRRYRIECLATIEKSPGKETTPRELLELGEIIHKHKVKVIFTEPQLNPKSAQILAAEFDLQTAVLDPLGGTFQNETITALIRQNWDTMFKNIK